MRIIILPALLIISSFVSAQNAYTKGYIVEMNGDTVRGDLREDLEETLSRSITFKDQSGVSKKLSTSDIKAFGFDQGPIFRQVHYLDPLNSLKTENHFAKLLVDGKYDLFSFRRKDNLFFVVVNSDTAYLLYDDITTQLGEIAEQGNYRNFLAFFARDCSKVDATAATVNFNEQAFISYFVSLEKCNGTFNAAMVSYSKPKTEKTIFVSAGGFAVDRKSEIFAQALIQFTWPDFSKKASINTGLTYSNHSNETTTIYSISKIEDKSVTEIFEIPLIIRYDLLQKRVRPYIYAGGAIGTKVQHETVSKIFFDTATTKTNYHSFGGTLLLGGGIAVNVYKNLLLNIDWHYDLLAHLPAIGIGYRSNKF